MKAIRRARAEQALSLVGAISRARERRHLWLSVIFLGTAFLLCLTAAEAQTPVLRSILLTPEEVTAGQRVQMRITFGSSGNAFPILTSSHPTVIQAVGGLRTNGSNVVIRSLETRPVSARTCVILTAHWGNTTRNDSVCVDPPSPPQPAACTSFGLSSPANGAQATSRTVTFAWGACQGASGYILRVRRVGSASNCEASGNDCYALNAGVSLQRTVTLPESPGNALEWWVSAQRPNGELDSPRRRLDITDCSVLTWASTITDCNFPGISQWPAPFRDRVRNRLSISDVVNSNVVVRGDNNLCSACHYQNVTFVQRYQPNVARFSSGTGISSLQNLPVGNGSSASWRNRFAQEFRNNVDGTVPGNGVKPGYLRDLFAEWIADGRRN